MRAPDLTVSGFLFSCGNLMSAAREYLPPIMVVDDDANDIELLRAALKSAEVANPLLTFVNSAEALAFLRSLPDTPEAPLLMPRVLFLDINMPNVHGFVFLKWVRSQSILDEVRVVVLSGSEKPADRERACKLGADQYLVKFPPPAVFADVVARIGGGLAIGGQ